jgi:hypothetical protein
MTVALSSTLRALAVKSLLYQGKWSSVVDRVTDGTDIFIGMAVTEYGEGTHGDIDPCAEIEAILGFVIGLAHQLETIPAEGEWYNDFDVPFGDGINVRVGIPQQNCVILVLSETNTSIAKGAKIKCVDGVWETADTNDNYQMIALEGVTGAANTRKYFKARWVKN